MAALALNSWDSAADRPGGQDKYPQVVLERRGPPEEAEAFTLEQKLAQAVAAGMLGPVLRYHPAPARKCPDPLPSSARSSTDWIP